MSSSASLSTFARTSWSRSCSRSAIGAEAPGDEEDSRLAPEQSRSLAATGSPSPAMKSGASRTAASVCSAAAPRSSCVSACAAPAQHVERKDDPGGADVEILHRRRRLPAVPLVSGPQRVDVERRVDVGDDPANRRRARVQRPTASRSAARTPPACRARRNSKLARCPKSSTSSRSSRPFRARPERNARSPTWSRPTCATARSRSTRTTPARRSARPPATSTRASRRPRRARRSSSARTSTPCRRPGGSSRSSTTTASCATRPGRSSAPTTSPRSPSCSRRRGACSPNGGRTPASSCSSRRRRRSGSSAPRRSTSPGSSRRHGFVYDQAAPIGEVILGAPFSQSMDVTFHGRASHAGMHPGGGSERDRRGRARDRRPSPRPGRRASRRRTSARSRRRCGEHRRRARAPSSRRRARTTSDVSPTSCRRCSSRSRSRPR